MMDPSARADQPLEMILEHYSLVRRVEGLEAAVPDLTNRVVRIESPLEPMLNEEDADRLRCIRGHVTEFCRDPLRYRTIRKAIASPNEELKECIVIEIESCVVELSCHPFGNYVIQDLVIYPQVHLPIFFNITSVAKDKYGVYVIKALFIRGNSDVKKLISATVVDSLDDLAKNKYGSRVVEQVFFNASTLLKDKVMMNLLQDGGGRIRSFMNNKFGLYVLKFFANHCSHEYRDPLIESMTNILASMQANLAEFATIEAAQKFLNEMSAA